MRYCIQLLIISMMALLSCCNFLYTKPKVATVYIQPFYPFSQQRTAQVASEVERFYHCRVVLLPERKISEEAGSKSGRYSAPILLDKLDQQVRGKGGKILALTSYDIFTESHGVKEWGILAWETAPAMPALYPISD
jgi:hypothetical protein